MADRSRMTGDCHVRICGRLRGRFPRPTRLFRLLIDSFSLIMRIYLQNPDRFKPINNDRLSSGKSVHCRRIVVENSALYRKYGNIQKIQNRKFVLKINKLAQESWPGKTGQGHKSELTISFYSYIFPFRTVFSL